jgi:hypothetical protein
LGSIRTVAALRFLGDCYYSGPRTASGAEEVPRPIVKTRRSVDLLATAIQDRDRRIGSLDGIRGIAVLLVVSLHYF